MNINSQSAKSEARRVIRRARALIPPLERHSAESAVVAMAKQLGLLRRGLKIAAYIPAGSEFSPWLLMLNALVRGVDVYLPKVPKRGRKLSFVRLDSTNRWKLGPQNILEPLGGEICPPRNLDIVFLPLLGFDASLARMGQGGGYYDCTFEFRRLRQSWKKPRLVGLAFDVQYFEQLPVDTWDLRLDYILTGKKVWRKP
ncbi:5-formyltetrahydrofolate cyclo-ligase [Iodobacter sp. HSC-16F04]|uniref:5-formyltetrahydrofolate cyclo-ligase n=1 Tax=Iodobacter violaceini TaxID=3044271 RepID=A0ABX0L3E6_9NEIS|nr:5-formyltetrahydrofolate cyclo-ligase [Iodobacter violacea]NHQ87138.1 5-formyltetrahydrofolate cyclo-ligase [Iodobacter violacea]